jgi:hypothetical protein
MDRFGPVIRVVDGYAIHVTSRVLAADGSQQIILNRKMNENRYAIQSYSAQNWQKVVQDFKISKLLVSVRH